MIQNFRKLKQEEARNAAIAGYREEIDKNKLTSDIVFVLLAENGTMDEVTATEHLDVFAQWEPSVSYTVGNLRAYQDKLYKCLQAHTSQEDWTPDVTPALWKEAGNPADEWPQWSQPIGAVDAYMKGDKVSYEEKHWISNTDNNVWAPGTGTLWILAEE